MKSKKETDGSEFNLGLDNQRNSKVKIKNVKKVSELGKIRGLMFRSRKKARALSFDFSKPTKAKIHSLFVGFPFIGIWFKSDGKIILIRKVSPWKIGIGPNEAFSKLVEIPINGFYRREIDHIVGSQKDL